MPTKAAVLVVHGIGGQSEIEFESEVQAMVDQVQGHFDGSKANPGDLTWQPAYWGDILQPHEDDLWTSLSAKNDMDYVDLRKFIIANLGDAAAYQREPGPDPDIYCLIHERIGRNITKLRRQAGGVDAPLIILAHSLGSYIMSNYIWDLQHPKGYCKNVSPHTAFEQMKTLAGFVTFGSSIALFTLALTKFQGLTFPPDELAGRIRNAAHWLNMYDPDDVLGYPIKPLCPEYHSHSQIEDHAINVGGLLTSWNPLSHNAYWTDNDFTKSVAELIEAIVSA